MVRFFHNLQVKALLLFSRPAFFHKINQLEWYRDTLRYWANEPQLDKKAAVLEIACETGSLSVYLYQYAAYVSAVDLSPAMIRRAKMYYPEIDFQVADATNLSIENETFDRVLCASLINIVPAAQAVEIIQSMARVCKPGGMIKILVPAKSFTQKNLEQLINRLGISGFSEACLRAWHQYPPKMSLRELQFLVEEAGLQLEDSDYFLDKMLLGVTARVRKA